MSENAAKPKTKTKRKRVAKPKVEEVADAAAATAAAAADLDPFPKIAGPRAAPFLKGRPAAAAAPRTEAKVWVSHDFHTFYPRLPRAVVRAPTEMDAKCCLDKMLAGRGLKTSTEMPYTIVEMKPTTSVYFFP